jgi:large subunit ribosomal protein L24
MDIKKGDTVEVMCGNDRGRRSTILSVIKDKGRVLVEGVNMRKHHTKPSQRDPQGGIMEREAPINVSNVMVICPKTDLPTRVRHKKLENGNNVRVSVRSGEMIDSQ